MAYVVFVLCISHSGSTLNHSNRNKNILKDIWQATKKTSIKPNALTYKAWEQMVFLSLSKMIINLIAFRGNTLNTFQWRSRSFTFQHLNSNSK